ncbi:MAG TPA: hypothetical protein DDW30_05895 [Clostridiales bacterium]|nr:hypothetical protein [Clostridiales bacterium]
MKRILIVLLTLAVLLTTVAVPTLAQEETTQEETERELVSIADDATTVELNGVTYQVVRTKAEFLAMKPNDEYVANFILANDIDFGNEELKAQMGTSDEPSTPGVVNAGNKLHNFILEGNGHRIFNLKLNFTASGSGLFPTATYRTLTIRHLTVETDATFGAEKCGVLFGSIPKDARETLLEDVTIKGTISSSSSKCGAFIGSYDNSANESTNKLTFSGCAMKAQIDAGAIQTGGYVGFLSGTGTVSFTDCSVDAQITAGNNRIGGYVGSLNGTGEVSFANCTSAGEMTGTGGKWFSGFVSAIYTTCNVTFTDCTNEMNLNGNQKNGGFIGGCSSASNATPTVTFRRCVNRGSVTGTGSYQGGFVGEVGNNKSTTAYQLSFYACTNLGSVTGSNQSGGMVGIVADKNLDVLFSDCANVGTVKATSEETKYTGGYIGRVYDGAKSLTYTRCLSAGTIDAPKGITYSTDYNDDVKCVLTDCYDLSGISTNRKGDSNEVSEERMRSGEVTFLLRSAQKAAGVSEAERFGQTIGAERIPLIGGKAVYEHEFDGRKYYSGNESATVIQPEEENRAKAYYQTMQASDGTQSVRIVICMDGAYLNEIEALSLEVVFGTATGGKKLTADLEDVHFWRSILAAGELAQAADGCVLMAFVVEGIPADAWNGELSVSMTVTGSERAMASYTLTTAD